MTLTVDRIEGECAVLVDADGRECGVPLAWLPEGAGEGAQVALHRDEAAEEELADSIRAHQRRFHGGDIEL